MDGPKLEWKYWVDYEVLYILEAEELW
jgi:hypothetical protein